MALVLMQWGTFGTLGGSRLKPSLYFLRMRYKFWRHKFAANNLYQLPCAELLGNTPCENSLVASHSQEV